MFVFMSVFVFMFMFMSVFMLVSMLVPVLVLVLVLVPMPMLGLFVCIYIQVCADYAVFTQFAFEAQRKILQSAGFNQADDFLLVRSQVNQAGQYHVTGGSGQGFDT